jgi:hypothetical protein
MAQRKWVSFGILGTFEITINLEIIQWLKANGYFFHILDIKVYKTI